MFRCVIARRTLAAFLVLAALASPALAGSGPAAPLDHAGFLDRFVAWLAEIWAGATPATDGDSLDGGCGLDPSGGCHGAVAPPAGEGGCILDPGGSGCGEDS